MGEPKRLRKKYQKPKHPWQASRINEERTLMNEYGVKNKKEIWRSSSKVRAWRRQARKITEMAEDKAEEAKKTLIKKLRKLGILDEKADLENVLDLKIKNLLERRLQTRLYKKGLSSTVKEARQFISHGKVTINGKIITSPSYIVKTSDNIALLPEFEKRIKENKAKPKKKENGKEE